MRLAQPRRGDPQEFDLALKRGDVRHAAVAHAAAEPAHHLVEDVGDRALVRHPALDPFGHHLARRELPVLEIAVGGAVLHRGEAPHAADQLVAAPFGEGALARALPPVPASNEPIMTDAAPAAIALTTSPEYLTPPSAMTGTSSAPRTASSMAVIWGTPTPVTTRRSEERRVGKECRS